MNFNLHHFGLLNSARELLNAIIISHGSPETFHFTSRHLLFIYDCKSELFFHYPPSTPLSNFSVSSHLLYRNKVNLEFSSVFSEPTFQSPRRISFSASLHSAFALSTRRSSSGRGRLIERLGNPISLSFSNSLNQGLFRHPICPEFFSLFISQGKIPVLRWRVSLLIAFYSLSASS